MAEWGFEKKRKDDPVSGGAQHFAINRKVHNFVRESIQNSWDQRLSDDQVSVRFSFFELEGEDLSTFLREINWTAGLEEHLRACADQNNHDKGKLRRNLDSLDKKRLRVLRVSDHGTRGLEGPEFGQKGNFCKLCRNEMIPTEGGANAGRGGSFGVGKSVYWAFSGLNTVVFSSLFTDGTGAERSRVFGRTYLPDHELGGIPGAPDVYSGDAYMCERDADGERVSMSFATAGVSRTSLLHRPAGDLGTSILVVMYDELESEDEVALSDIADHFAHAIVANFWPMLSEDKLVAEVDWTGRGGNGSIQVLLPAEFDPLVRALQHSQDIDAFAGSGDPELLEAGATAHFSASIRIPSRKDPDDPQPAAPEAQVAVNVTRLTEEERARLAAFEDRYGDMKFVNQFANIRGAKMVVETRSYVSGGCFDHVGVVRAGHFRDTSGKTAPKDDLVEKFLRDCEPPAHDSWDKLKDKIKNSYERPYSGVVAQMYKDVSDKAKKLLRAVMQGDKDRPDGLAKLLAGKPIQTEDDDDTGTNGHRFRSEMVSCTFDLANRKAHYVIRAKRVGGARGVLVPWSATVQIKAASEAGPSALDIIEATADGIVIIPIGAGVNATSCTATVPPGTNKVDIALTISLDSLSDTVIPRIRLFHDCRMKAG